MRITGNLVSGFFWLCRSPSLSFSVSAFRARTSCYWVYDNRSRRRSNTIANDCCTVKAVVVEWFIAGIRRHWRPFILIYFVIGVLYLLVHLNEALIYFGLGVSPEIQGVLLAINWFVFYLFVIAFGFMQTQIVLYKSSVWQLINNALRFTFGSLLKNALMAMLCFFPLMVFDWVPSPIAEWVSFGFAGFGYFALASLFFTAYSYTLFDRYINKRAFPDLNRKGLNCDD